MQRSDTLSNDIVLRWLEPIGTAFRLLMQGFAPSGLSYFTYERFASACLWMGPGSFIVIVGCAMLIALALTTDAVVEMRHLRAQDLSGAVIAIGLLREIGPVTVGMAWGSRVAVRLCCEGKAISRHVSESAYAGGFVLPNLLAAYLMSIPLSIFGLTFGFLTAAFFAPTQGVSTTTDFMETARLFIQDKDVIAFFVKLVLVNPTIAVLTGCAFGCTRTRGDTKAEGQVIAVFFLITYLVSLIWTYGAYARG